MNTVDLESENSLSVAKQAQVTKHTFEWPDDRQETTTPVNPNAKWIQGEHLLNWAVFWFMTWLGTTVAGALFGGMLGLVSIASYLSAPLMGLIYGGLWAGAVGLFVFVHLAVICWTFWWLSRPLMSASIAGILTGAICGLMLFSIVTAPLGALGAYLAGGSFLKSTKGKQFLTTIKAAQDRSLGPMSFTMMDLMLRFTVIAVFIAGWTAWLKSY